MRCKKLTFVSEASLRQIRVLGLDLYHCFAKCDAPWPRVTGVYLLIAHLAPMALTNRGNGIMELVKKKTSSSARTLFIPINEPRGLTARRK